MDKKKTSSTNDQQQFSEYLDKATAIVRDWPEWKQRVLGVLTANDPGSKNNAEPAKDDKK